MKYHEVSIKSDRWFRRGKIGLKNQSVRNDTVSTGDRKVGEAVRYRRCVLPPFHNINHFSIFHIHINVNESRHIYLSRFININMNVKNTRMTYIM